MYEFRLFCCTIEQIFALTLLGFNFGIKLPTTEKENLTKVLQNVIKLTWFFQNGFGKFLI